MIKAVNKDFDGNEQALIAVLCEVNKMGINLTELSEVVCSGIMGNKPYAFVGAEYKSKAIEDLKRAIKEAEKL